MLFELFTAYPPTVNNYYVKTHRNVHISSKGKKFADQLAKDAAEQIGGMPMITEKVAIDIIAYVPDLRKRDMDNILKPIFDSMTRAGLWEDDSLVDQIRVYRGAKTPGGSLYISVSEAAFTIPLGMHHIIHAGE